MVVLHLDDGLSRGNLEESGGSAAMYAGSLSGFPTTPMEFARFWVTNSLLQIETASVATNKLREIIVQSNAVYLEHRLDEVRIVIAHTKAIRGWVESFSHLLWELRNRHEGYAMEDWLDAERTIYESVNEALNRVEIDFAHFPLPLTRPNEDAWPGYDRAIGELMDQLERMIMQPLGEADAEIDLPEIAEASVHVESDSKEYFDEVTEAAKNLARIMGYEVAENGAVKK